MIHFKEMLTFSHKQTGKIYTQFPLKWISIKTLKLCVGKLKHTPQKHIQVDKINKRNRSGYKYNFKVRKTSFFLIYILK